ncbi:hypothetical protein MJO47_15005 [Desulfuromonas sp. KJ2020]|uniref:hypothetical protein n=1 Tax=Desulfuromonas sp. KJ2020 TaxID=2919173 RepID=UPI0020A7D9AE|nr:hypothetical protein [Desulfuromonas sp. KJ2020]MCP3178413.1 hypothetical protein [Desulfuromonas sp. KJ2020]
MSLQEIALIAASALWLLTCVVLLLLLVRLRRLDGQNGALRQQLDEALARLEQLESQTTANGTPIDARPDKEQLRAQLKARLDLSAAGSSLPEKYRYLASMAGHGMKAEDIADVLDISPREAEQLVRLAQVGRRNSNA